MMGGEENGGASNATDGQGEMIVHEDLERYAAVQDRIAKEGARADDRKEKSAFPVDENINKQLVTW